LLLLLSVPHLMLLLVGCPAHGHLLPRPFAFVELLKLIPSQLVLLIVNRGSMHTD
jgi:hypothetical protein